MDKPPAYIDRVVAFVDILGFRVHVSSLSDNPELHRRLHYALTYIKSYRGSSRTGNTAHSNLEVSFFSDSIAISSRPPNAFDVIWACGWLQARLLYSGILTRGGISIGLTIHEDDVIYGEGMLRACDIESSAAVYPRIVIDPIFLPQLGVGIKLLLDQDSDGLWFVDPFKFDAMPESAEDLASDGYDPREVYFENVGNHITSGVKEAKQVGRIAKWNWLSNRFRTASEKYSRNRELNLDSLLKAAEQGTVTDTDKRRR